MRPRISQVLIAVSLAVNAILVVGSLAVVANLGGWYWLRREVEEVFPALSTREPSALYAANRRSQFAVLPVGPDDIVLLGDSIFDYGEWHEFLGTDRAKNRAINGDETHRVLNRLQQVLAGRPHRVVFLLGINNLQAHIPLEQTVREYAQIVNQLTSPACGSEVWILPVIPVNTRLFTEHLVPDHPTVLPPRAADVAAINAFIRGQVARQPSVHLVETPELLDAAGEMSEAYTFDGLHLNGAGLKCVADRLRREVPGLDGSHAGGAALSAAVSR